MPKADILRCGSDWRYSITSRVFTLRQTKGIRCSWHREIRAYIRSMLAPVCYSYRQLTRADVSLLKDLLRVFGEAFDEISTYQCSVPTDDYLIRVLTKQHFIAIVAMNGNEVVGGLAAYELDKFEQDRREIYIYDLAVVESHRRRGVATGLISELRKIASERNVYVIFVQANTEDGPAIALYDSLGTKESAYHFDIEAAPNPVSTTPRT